MAQDTRHLESGYATPEYKGTREYRLATLADIEAARSGEMLALSDKSKVHRVRINGAIKRWKRDRARFDVPVKYGMYECWHVNNSIQSGWNPGTLLVEVDRS